MRETSDAAEICCHCPQCFELSVLRDANHALASLRDGTRTQPTTGYSWNGHQHEVPAPLVYFSFLAILLGSALPNNLAAVPCCFVVRGIA